MVSEFHQLADKVRQLAELAQSLRRENADLRHSLAGLAAENADLSKRMEEAHRRVAALIEKLPAGDESKEAA